MYSPYLKFISTFREFQKNALIACQTDVQKGSVHCPCGCGKTLIQIAWHINDIISKNNQEIGTYLIASPRLILNLQLQNQFIDLLIQCGIFFNILFNSSLKIDYKKYYEKYAHLEYSPKISEYLQTTNKEKIAEFATKTRDQNRNLIIISTYDSLDRLSKIDHINQASFDEAHFLLGKKHHLKLLAIRDNIQKQRYFTATPRTKKGIKSSDVYGDVLFDYSPSKALKDGEIVQPKIHFISSKNGKLFDENNISMLVHSITSGFLHHQKLILDPKNISLLEADSNLFDQQSPEYKDIAPKLLVACHSRKQLEKIVKDENLLSFCNKRNIVLAGITSEGGAFYNGKKISTNQFQNKIKELSDTQPAIILNVEMLTVGWDLPSISGVLPLRSMKIIELYQFYSRALRLLQKDREKYYSGEISPNKPEEYIKGYGWIIFPQHLSSLKKQTLLYSIRHIIYNKLSEKTMNSKTIENIVSHKNILVSEKNAGRNLSIWEKLEVAAIEGVEKATSNVSPIITASQQKTAPIISSVKQKMEPVMLVSEQAFIFAKDKITKLWK
jgi:superfamily II DNA or RNA helicase